MAKLFKVVATFLLGLQVALSTGFAGGNLPYCPPDEAAKIWVLGYLQGQSSGAIELVSFEKTGGRYGVVHRATQYVMDFTLVIRFLCDGRWVMPSDFNPTLTFFVVPDQADSERPGAGNPPSRKRLPGLLVGRGSRFIITGRMRSELTDMGWMVDEIFRSAIKPIANPIANPTSASESEAPIPARHRFLGPGTTGASSSRTSGSRRVSSFLTQSWRYALRLMPSLAARSLAAESKSGGKEMPWLT